MVFYFTGSGSSRFVAEHIGEALNEDVVSIGEALREEHFDYSVKPGETIGFVCPTYFWGLPTAVLDFLTRLTIRGAHGVYTYAVLTCGAMTGMAGDMLAEMLRRKGHTLSAQYGIKCVDNYVPAFKVGTPEQIAKRMASAEAETNTVIAQIRSRAEGDLNPHHSGLTVSLAFAPYELYRKGRKTAKFSVDVSRCVGCGLCENICPCRAIILQDGAPHWEKPQCTLCLGCLHRCPEGAITYGKSAKNGRFVNPTVKW